MAHSLCIDGVLVELMVDVFARNAQTIGDKIAIKGQDRVFTYAQLDGLSNRVADWLLGQGVRRGDIVLVRSRRRVEVFVGFLGVWKIGAVFAYIDEKAPDTQRRKVEDDLRPRAVLDAPDMDALVTRGAMEPPAVDDLGLEDVACIIITSGTTGRPKYVRILQRNLSVSMRANVLALGITSSDVKSMLASFSFMSGLTESLPTLLAGGTVCMIPEGIKRNIADIAQFISDEKITASFLPAHMAERFTADYVMPESFRLLTTGGEAAHYIHPASYEIMLCYGMTEVAGPVMCHRVRECVYDYFYDEMFPFTRCYVAGDLPVAVHEVGAIGEVCFAGLGVCDGYSGRDDLNERTFISNPFDTDAGYERLFRTGDYARIEAEGSLHLVGRSDLMCKIRSFRIEINEVESAVMRFQGVERCVVKPLYDACGRLELHLMYCSAGDIDEAQLKDFLRENLLHYKVPKFFHRLRSMPLTDNGKVDRKAVGVVGFYEEDPRLDLVAAG